MKRKIVAVALVVLMVAAFGAFAKETKPSKQFPWMADFNKAGQINLYAAAGWYGLGFDISAGPEFIIGGFNLGGIPLEWGVAIRGLVGFGSFFGYASWIDYGAAVMASLHWGMDFGAPWKFDTYGGLGVGISGSTGSYYSAAYLGGLPIGIGPASFQGVAWHFADNFAIILDTAWTYYQWVSGIGIEMNL